MLQVRILLQPLELVVCREVSGADAVIRPPDVVPAWTAVGKRAEAS